MPSCHSLRMLHQMADTLQHCKTQLLISSIFSQHHHPPQAMYTNYILLSTLNSYAAGLVHFTNFCDDSNIPEEDRMPASESLLSHFIASHSAGSVGLCSMKTWLEGICLWHHINEAPWQGHAILNRTLNGVAKFSPIESIQPKCEPVTIEHLKSLCHHLDLSNSFYISVFAVACVAFWSCCR